MSGRVCMLTTINCPIHCRSFNWSFIAIVIKLNRHYGGNTQAVLEIAADHWPFSDQFYHLANKNPFWLAKFTVHFQWDGNQWPTTYDFQKMTDQFLTPISTTVHWHWHFIWTYKISNRTVKEHKYTWLIFQWRICKIKMLEIISKKETKYTIWQGHSENKMVQIGHTLKNYGGNTIELYQLMYLLT